MTVTLPRVPRRMTRLTGEARERLQNAVVASYRHGMSVREIAAYYNRSYGSVHSMLREADVALRQRGGYRRESSSTD